MRYDAFYPGEVWLDTEGKPIQAHGGSIIRVGNVWYWYGENKEHTDGKNGVWTWGIRCYRSRDLYNWEDCGLIIPPVLDDEASPLHPTAMIDRPHIIYNRRTGKYVCWFKIMQKSGEQHETVLTADDILGPYEIVRTGLRPLGMSAGDFDLAVAPDGKAYYYFERVHSETICADLTEDYTDVTGYYTTHFPHSAPPYVREATSHFVRKGKHYLITSGTTGYLPNPSEVAVADTWHGPYTVLGNPHPGDASNTSFHTQISCVFQVPERKDLFIAMADRWCPDLMDLDYERYKRFYEIRFDAELSEVEKEAAIADLSLDMKQIDDLRRNTSIATYAWLPIRFDGDMAYIDWRDEWRWENAGIE